MSSIICMVIQVNGCRMDPPYFSQVNIQLAQHHLLNNLYYLCNLKNEGIFVSVNKMHLKKENSNCYKLTTGSHVSQMQHVDPIWILI